MRHYFPEETNVFSSTTHFFKPDRQTGQGQISVWSTAGGARKHIPVNGLARLGLTAESLWGYLGSIAQSPSTRRDILT